MTFPQAFVVSFQTPEGHPAVTEASNLSVYPISQSGDSVVAGNIALISSDRVNGPYLLSNSLATEAPSSSRVVSRDLNGVSSLRRVTSFLDHFN